MWPDEVGPSAEVHDRAGTLRLTRTGSTLFGHYWDGTGFVQLSPSLEVGTGPTGITLGLPGTSPDALPVTVAFDTFRVVDGTVDCPSVPETPSLISLGLAPQNPDPGDTIHIDIDATGTTQVVAVFFERPAGTSDGLPIDPFGQSGTVFSSSINLSASAATGTWLVREIVVSGDDGQQYHFLHPDLFPGIQDCSLGFQDIGPAPIGGACTSTVISANGEINVGGSNFPPPDPALQSVSFNPDTIALHGQTELSATITDTERITSAFIVRQTDQSPAGVVFGSSTKTGDFLAITVTEIGTTTGFGAYVISELVTENAIDEEFRFLNPDLFQEYLPVPPSRTLAPALAVRPPCYRV